MVGTVGFAIFYWCRNDLQIPVLFWVVMMYAVSAVQMAHRIGLVLLGQIWWFRWDCSSRCGYDLGLQAKRTHLLFK